MSTLRAQSMRRPQLSSCRYPSFVAIQRAAPRLLLALAERQYLLAVVPGLGISKLCFLRFASLSFVPVVGISIDSQSHPLQTLRCARFENNTITAATCVVQRYIMWASLTEDIRRQLNINRDACVGTMGVMFCHNTRVSWFTFIRNIVECGCVQLFCSYHIPPLR